MWDPDRFFFNYANTERWQCLFFKQKHHINAFAVDISLGISFINTTKRNTKI